MNHTSRLHLPLFEATDKPSWLTDWNGAMNKLDEAISDLEIGNIPGMQDLLDRLVAVEASVTAGQEIMSAIELNFASRFNSATTYSHGDYCVYDHSLYKYTDPTPSSGDFDGTKWSIRSVSSIVEEIYYQINSAVSSINNEIGTNSTAGSIKGRITDVETEIGTDSTPNTIKGRITTLENGSGGGTQIKDVMSIMNWLLQYSQGIGNLYLFQEDFIYHNAVSLKTNYKCETNGMGVGAPDLRLNLQSSSVGIPIFDGTQMSEGQVITESDLLAAGSYYHVTESDRYYLVSVQPQLSFSISSPNVSAGLPDVKCNGAGQSTEILLSNTANISGAFCKMTDRAAQSLVPYNISGGNTYCTLYLTPVVYALNKNFTITAKRNTAASIIMGRITKSFTPVGPINNTQGNVEFYIVGEKTFEQLLS